MKQYVKPEIEVEVIKDDIVMESTVTPATPSDINVSDDPGLPK